MVNAETYKRIEAILHNQDFRDFVESQIGIVKKVEVDWKKKEVRIKGLREGRSFPFELFLQLEKGLGL